MPSRNGDPRRRLCILGNSHVGALKRAWDARGTANPEADVAPTFFASRHRGLSQARVEGRHLVPGTEDLARDLAFTSGGDGTVALDDFDAFLVYGLFVPAYRDAGQSYSAACRMAALHDHFDHRIGVILAQSLRAAVDVPVLIAHDPLPADPGGVQGRPAARRDHYRDTIAMVNERFFAPAGLTMLAQPAETRVPERPFFTRAAYARGSRRLAVGDALDDGAHPHEDRLHMNDAFGALALDTVLEALRSR